LFFYQGHETFNGSFLFAAVLAGAVTAGFYGFFPLYFPELFPTAVRATGQGFAFNFGRVIAAIGGLQTANLKAYFDGDLPKAGSALAAIYLIGVVIVWFGPETRGKDLPD
jgi:SHS family sialic acid transporter-like MFS transporter